MLRMFVVKQSTVMISNDAGKALDFALAFMHEPSDHGQVEHLRRMLNGCMEEYGMLQVVVNCEPYALMVKAVPNGVEAEVTHIIEVNGGREIWIQ